MIRATAKEPHNPQNHNKPSQTNKMNKLKKRQRQLHFTGASAQTTIKQLTTRPHTDKITKRETVRFVRGRLYAVKQSRGAGTAMCWGREEMFWDREGNVLGPRQCAGAAKKCSGAEQARSWAAKKYMLRGAKNALGAEKAMCRGRGEMLGREGNVSGRRRQCVGAGKKMSWGRETPDPVSPY